MKTAALERLDRLGALLAQDERNPLLLADAADAALAGGAFDQAQACIDRGIAAEGPTPHWRFRSASLHIARRRLPEARALLEGLREPGAPEPAVEHNLAHVAFLDGDMVGCAALLEPWLRRGLPPGMADAVEVLWLRALHHLGRLATAWEHVEQRGIVRLGASAAGVASLVALDLGRWDAAEQLAAAALARDARQPEAAITRACVLLARRRLAEARDLLGQVTTEHPHQPRAWGALGLVELLRGNAEAARVHLAQAVALAPGDVQLRVAAGWAALREGDRAAAIAAFREALAIDGGSADAHGGLAVALALDGTRGAAADHAGQARRLQPGHLAARYAVAILSGNARGLHGVQKLVERLVGQG